jgi:uncharacterized protein YbcI
MLSGGKHDIGHTHIGGTGEPSVKTRGELETEVSNAVIRFKREYMGRGPQEVRTFLVEDMALVRLRGVLTPAEQRLAQVEDPHRGRDLIKQVRLELIEHGREILEGVVQGILGVRVLSVHTDISTRTGESVIVFTLSDDPVGKARANA